LTDTSLYICICVKHFGMSNIKNSQCCAWPFYRQERELVLLHGTRWVRGLVWMGAEGLAPIGVQFPDRPAPRKSLYWLQNPGSQLHREFFN